MLLLVEKNTQNHHHVSIDSVQLHAVNQNRVWQVKPKKKQQHIHRREKALFKA